MPYSGELSALLTALLWSISSILFTKLTTKIKTVELNILRLIFAFIFLTITILAFRLQIQITKEQVILLSLSGLIGLVIGDSFLFMAFSKIGPRITMLIMSFNPAMAALFAYIFLGEKIPAFGLIGVLITIVGIIFVLYDRPVLKEITFHSPEEDKIIQFKDSKKSKSLIELGILFAVLGALGQAISLIFIKKAFTFGPIHGLIATNVRILSSLIIFVPFSILFKKYISPKELINNVKGSLGLVALASLIGPYLGITFSIIAVSNTKDVGIAATLMATIPIMMLPLSHFIYKEKLKWKSITGTIVAVVGVAILFLID